MASDEWDSGFFAGVVVILVLDVVFFAGFGVGRSSVDWMPPQQQAEATHD